MNHTSMASPQIKTVSDPMLAKKILFSRAFDVVNLEDYLTTLQKEAGIKIDALQNFARNILFFVNGPEHLARRKKAIHFFKKSAIQPWENTIQMVVDKTLEELATKEIVDLAIDFTAPVSSASICHILGLPAEKVELYDLWAEEIIWVIEPMLSMRKTKAINQYAEEFYREIDLAYQQAVPSDPPTFLHAMRESQVLPEEDIKWLAMVVYIAGQSTKHTLANILAQVCQTDNETRNRIIDEARTHEITVNLLRDHASIQYISRIANQDVEVEGQTFHKGDKIDIQISEASKALAGSRCPFSTQVGENQRVSSGLSFGKGVHKCIGEAVSRIITSRAITSILTKFPNISLAESELEYFQSRTLKKPARLLCKLN